MYGSKLLNLPLSKDLDRYKPMQTRNNMLSPVSIHKVTVYQLVYHLNMRNTYSKYPTYPLHIRDFSLPHLMIGECIMFFLFNDLLIFCSQKSTYYSLQILNTVKLNTQFDRGPTYRLTLRYCLTYPYLNLRDFQPQQARFNFDAAVPQRKNRWAEPETSRKERERGIYIYI